MDKLPELYACVDGWWQGLLEHCIGCDNDYRRLIGLLPEEADRFVELGVAVMEVNERINFIHSLPSGPDGQIDLTAVKPRCSQYSEGKCLTYAHRPLICRMYPVGIQLTDSGGVNAVLHLDCVLARR